MLYHSLTTSTRHLLLPVVLLWRQTDDRLLVILALRYLGLLGLLHVICDGWLSVLVLALEEVVESGLFTVVMIEKSGANLCKRIG